MHTTTHNTEIQSPFVSPSCCTQRVPIKPPLCVYSSTPPGQSWAGWSVPALQWTGQGCGWAGRGGAGRLGHSRGSRSGECAWRSGRLSGWARSSPSSRPPGRCSLLVPRISCRGWQIKNTVTWKEKKSHSNILTSNLLKHTDRKIHSSGWHCVC